MSNDFGFGARRRCSLAGTVLIFSGFRPEAVRSRFVKMPLWWSDYEGSRLLFTPTPTFRSYHSTLSLLNNRYSLVFRIAVAKHFGFILLSFFRFALIGRPVDYARKFKSEAAVAKSGVLFPLPCDVQAFVTDIGMFSFLQGSQFHVREAHLAHHRGSEMD